MSFHVRIALSNVHKEPSRSVVAIGDTVIVTDTTTQVVTSAIQKKYVEISYSLEDSDDEKPVDKPKAKAKAAPAKKVVQSSEDEYDDESNSQEIIVQGRTGDSVIKSTRLRSKANEQKQKLHDIENRKDH